MANCNSRSIVKPLVATFPKNSGSDFQKKRNTKLKFRSRQGPRQVWVDAPTMLNCNYDRLCSVYVTHSSTRRDSQSHWHGPGGERCGTLQRLILKIFNLNLQKFTTKIFTLIENIATVIIYSVYSGEPKGCRNTLKF